MYQKLFWHTAQRKRTQIWIVGLVEGNELGFDTHDIWLRLDLKALDRTYHPTDFRCLLPETNRISCSRRENPPVWNTTPSLATPPSVRTRPDSMGNCSLGLYLAGREWSTNRETDTIGDILGRTAMAPLLATGQVVITEIHTIGTSHTPDKRKILPSK